MTLDSPIGGIVLLLISFLLLAVMTVDVIITVFAAGSGMPIAIYTTIWVFQMVTLFAGFSLLP